MRIRLTSSHVLLAAALALVTGCAGTPRIGSRTMADLGPSDRGTESLGPADFAINNRSACFARVTAVEPGRLDASTNVLAEVAPMQKTVVTVPAGRRLDIMTFTQPNAALGTAGRDCRRSGVVEWERVNQRG